MTTGLKNIKFVFFSSYRDFWSLNILRSQRWPTIPQTSLPQYLGIFILPQFLSNLNHD